ncbi:MAG TPA: hypothetical protein VFL83_03415 [Anaeromyxobacter sp.]|nr:hypothetical protein [Anaeromyxobacter sp.]
MSREPYDLDALLQAYVDTIAPLPAAVAPLHPWFEHLLSVLSRSFGVSFEEREVAPERREVLVALKLVLRHEADLPYPARGAFEAGLVYGRCQAEFDALFSALADLRRFYRGVARELALALWGELGQRTDEELVAAGLDYSRQPVRDP